MDSVNKTLYSPLYGKAFVSQKGLFLHDKKAEEIWAAEGFTLRGKARSKWLAYYMGIRSATFDEWLREKTSAMPGATVIHIGCGMDSRCQRIRGRNWFDVDFPAVIQERKRYYQETEDYWMISADITDPHWLEQLPKGKTIVLMEGVSMYLSPEKLKQALERMAAHFESVHLLMDCYTTFAAKASRHRNPINDVGVTQVYGMDDPTTVEGFVREHNMTPQELIHELQGMERKIFQTLYAGGVARKMYRLYEYRRP